jgi:hypothetical protein
VPLPFEEDSPKLKALVVAALRLVILRSVPRLLCFDADTGKDMAVQIREYYIPDFSNWEDESSFARGFDRLLQDLRLNV